MGFSNFDFDFRLAELLQEAQVVFDEVADVRDGGDDHGEALEAEAEGQAGDFSGIVGVVAAACVDGLEDGGIDHAAAGELQPARRRRGRGP